MLISVSGPAVVGHDLRQRVPMAEPARGPIGADGLVLPLSLLALLRLTDTLLPDRREDRADQSWRQLVPPSPWCYWSCARAGRRRLDPVGELDARSLGHRIGGPQRAVGGMVLLSWLFSQIVALPLLVHERCRALQAMDHSRQLVHRNGLKVLALLGMLLGSICWG